MPKSTYYNQGFLDAIKSLYLSEEFADVHFVIDSGDGKCERIPAHKLVLDTSIPYLFKKPHYEHEDIEIKRVTTAAFKEFLQFCYYDKVELTTENIEGVVRICEEYSCEDFHDICLDFMIEHLTIGNVCSTYGLVSLSDKGLDRMTGICDALIGIETKTIFKTKGFLECNEWVLKDILRLDSLSCSEVDLFEAYMAWVKKASKQSDVNNKTVMAHLGDLFYDIRFGAMTPGELNGIFSSYANLFTPELRSKIAKMIQSRTAYTEVNKRQCAWDKEAAVEFVRDIEGLCEENEPYELQRTETTTFTANHTLLLRAIVCGEIQEFRKGKHMKPSEVILGGKLSVVEYRGKYKADGSNSRAIYKEDGLIVDRVIHLAKPILIKPELNYRICLEILKNGGYPLCTDFRLKSNQVQVECRHRYPRDVIVNFINGTEHHGTKRGLIYGLHFNAV